MLKTIIHKLDPAPDAISMLKEDHRKVEALFAEIEAVEDGRTRGSMARRICTELEIHAKVEEQLFYPAAKRQAKESTCDVNEGIVEHEGIKRLVREIQRMSPSDELFDSKLTVLKEYVRHHVHEEEHSMFPKIIESQIDLKALGQKVAALKRKLQAESEPRPAKGPVRNSRPRSRKRVAEPA